MNQPSSNKEKLEYALWDFFDSLQSKNTKDAESIKSKIIDNIKKQDIYNDIFFHPETIKAIPDKEKREKFINIVFLQEVELTEEILSDLSSHIQNSCIGDKIDIDKLYEYNMAHTDIVDEHFNTDILSKFMSNSSKSQIHEAQALIYFYLESFEISKKDIDEMKSNCKDDADLVIEIVNRINQASLMEPSFEITEKKSFHGGKIKHITFKKKGSGLPDILLYNNEKSSFTLGFATTAIDVEHEGKSIIRHQIVILGIINSILENKKEIKLNKFSNPKTRQRNSIKRIQSYMYDIYGEEFKELFTQQDYEKFETVFKKYNANGSGGDINSLYKSMINSSPNKSIDSFIENIETKGINFKTYFLGKIDSPKNKIDKIGKYTTEEILTLIMSEAFKSKFNYGAGDLIIDSKNSTKLINSMRFRFNTRNKKRAKIINLEFINKEKESFLPFYIENFLSKKDFIGDDFRFATTHLNNMSIIDSKIIHDLSVYIKDKVNYIGRNIENIDLSENININEIVSSYFKSKGISSKVTLDILEENINLKYKNQLDLNNYTSIIDKIKDINKQNETLDIYKDIYNKGQSFASNKRKK